MPAIMRSSALLRCVAISLSIEAQLPTMGSVQPPATLLEHDVVIMRLAKTLDFSEHEFDIFDQSWNPVGAVRATEEGAKHPIFPPRELAIRDSTGLLCVMQDRFKGRTHDYEIAAPTGAIIGIARGFAEITNPSMTLDIHDSTRFLISGALFERYFQVSLNGIPVAHATRESADPLQERLVDERYYMVFDPKMPPHHRAALLGALLALGRMRGKLTNNG